VASKTDEEKPGQEDEEEDVPFLEEVSADDPLVIALEERLKKINGNDELTLENVLNPGAIVNAERELILLRAELAATPEEDVETRQQLQDGIDAKQKKIAYEMQCVMSDNFKLTFIVQAIGSILVWGSFACNTWPWYPDWRWLGVNRLGVKLIFNTFGGWGIWLLTLPALRARKPGGPYGQGPQEKRALDIAYLSTLPVCLFLPYIDKSPATCFWVSLAILVGSYAWSFNTPLETEIVGGRRGAGGVPKELKWVLQALDFGTGQERGAKSEDTLWKEKLASLEREAEKLAAAKKAQKEAQKSEA